MASNSSDSSDSSGTMLALSMGMQGISSILGGIEEGQSIEAQAAYQTAVADANSKLATLQGTEALAMGSLAASRRNIQARQQVGSAKTAIAAGGVDLSSGTARQVITATQSVGMQDELMIRNNAARQAWGYQVQAIQSSFAGKFAGLTGQAQANQTILTGGIKAISEPLSTYATYMKYSRGIGGGGSSAAMPESEFEGMV